MFELIEVCRSIFLLSIGAIFGSWARMHLTSSFALIFSSKYWATCSVNIASAFFLGLFLSFQSHSGLNFSDNNSLSIFVCVGFLGSLSTFSTFIIDLLNILLNQRWKQFLSLSLCSLFGGLIAAFVGLSLGNA